MGKVTEGCVFWTCGHGLDDHQNVGGDTEVSSAATD